VEKMSEPQPQLPKMPKGKLIDFEPIKESWNEYLLADGNTLRVKCIATKIIKTGQIAPDGASVYVFQSQNVVAVIRPNEEKEAKPNLKP
jgi:hypothetical protein